MAFLGDYSESNNSGSLENIVPRSRRSESRTNISQLPSLPSDISYSYADSDEEFSDGPKITASHDHHDHPSSSFIEFDLSERSVNAKFRSQENLPVVNEEPKSTKEAELQTEPAKQSTDDDFFNDNKASWKTMNRITELDYYDDQGNLQFGKSDINDIFDPKKNVAGYTRIDTEEQVAKYKKLDEATDFLFVVSKEPKAQAAYRDDDNLDSDSDYEEEEENLDTGETLQSTKNMLSEAQKFSYVGIVKLIIRDMATDLAKIKISTSNKIAKALNTSQKNFANWSMYVTDKIYTHLELSTSEQKMIDNLSIHGLEVSDLVGSLKAENKQKDESQMKWILICDLFLLLLSDGYYDSRSRCLLVRFVHTLDVSSLELYQFERRLIGSLELVTKDRTIEDKEELLDDKGFIEKRIKNNKTRRLAFIGLATLGGGLAIGLSAGLLAPLIGAGVAAGLTTVGITGTSGFLAGVGGSAIITTGGIVVGARVGANAGSRRAADVQIFELKPLHNNKRANLIITVSGWMIGQADDVRLPFSTVDPVMGDLFSLLWEPEMLRSMGQTINILASEALSTSIQQILGATILTSLMAAIQIPMALSKLSYLVDNPWSVSLDRAWKGGKLLADTLISGNLGVRPITLVGFSLGARLIYSCLIDLAKRGGYGLIENVIILGSPITIKNDQIALARSVVTGRFVNGYSKQDWVLGYLFRATGGGLMTVGGLSPIEGCHGIENLDCTDLVQGHMAYRKVIPKILKKLDWEVLNEEFTELEEPDTEQGEKQRQLIIEFDEARAKMKKEMEEQTHEEKKGWKRFFRPKERNWWSYGDIGKPKTPEEAPTSEEYHVDDSTAAQNIPLFDVNALMEEVKDIERLAKKDDATLEDVRQNLDTSARKVKLNEDAEGQS